MVWLLCFKGWNGLVCGLCLIIYVDLLGRFALWVVLDQGKTVLFYRSGLYAGWLCWLWACDRCRETRIRGLLSLVGFILIGY